MSYLAQYAVPEAALGPARSGPRVDLDVRLNRPLFDGGASMSAFVEDTSRRRRRSSKLPSPRLRLQISDCVNEINLEFSVDSYDVRENSLHKIDTLLDALAQFRAGLAAEAALRAQRERGDCKR
jgi:hypothetical protein